MSDDDDDVKRRRDEIIRITDAAVNRTVDVMRHAVDVALQVGHSTDEARICLRDEFMVRGVRRVEEGNTDGAQADYANYCAVILALINARDMIAHLEGSIGIRDSLIEILETDVIKVRRKDG
jgi:hypothetical protein